MRGIFFSVSGQETLINRGTPALLAAVPWPPARFWAARLPKPFLAGDDGLGKGSRLIYTSTWRNTLARYRTSVCFAFHYLQPDVDWHNKVLFAAREMEKLPILSGRCGIHVRSQDERPGPGL